MKRFGLFLLAVLLLMACTDKKGEFVRPNDRSAFVTLTDAVPTRIDGYEEPTALLTKQAADSLQVVSKEVMKMGYRLKIYDAYRPQKAVDHFVRWSKDANDSLMKRYFYPQLEKDVLFPQGYIAEQSGHTRGSTVDLTLFDMGGTFDWFGIESHPDFGGNPDTFEYTPNDSITEEQFQHRMLLRKVMLSHGFKPVDTEWWHFTLVDEPFPDTYFTFPVKQIKKQ